ncbi:response regulator [Kordiimonas aquimaris]|uniref:response regulator n=1 Tax=Kordiimonas aquimaris TaxID=707591 RepID=UPI0021CF4822|nr:response regulator [Kordiimonas aquimaris]
MFNAANMQDAPLSLCVVDIEGRVSFCNAAFEQLVGGIPAGQSIEETLIFDGVISDLINTMAGQPLVVRARAISDATLDFHVILTPMEDDSSFLLQLISSEGAELPVKAPSATNRVNIDFLSAVSHQIRTPVNGVLGIAELLTETSLSPEQAKYVDILSRSGHALIHLVNEIQDIALLEQGASTVSKDVFNVRDVVRDAMDLFSVSVSQKGIVGVADVDISVPDAVVADRKKLHQILVNLVGNAFQYSDQGKVTVSVKMLNDAGQNSLAIDVIDQGIGIDADRLPELLNKTAISKSNDSRAYSKTGLGLILCHEFVKLMGGTIAIESAVGRGTHVKMSIPVAEAGHEENTPENDSISDEQPSAYNEDGGPWHLLVTEDNPVNQMLFKKILERYGHKVTVASNGQEAVAKVQLGTKFDAILMDISMPVMDGLDATAMIRSLFGPAGSTPILALTAHAMDGDREKFLNAGMDGYQSKPVDPATLQQAIGEVIRAHSESMDLTAPTQWAPQGNGQGH